MSVQLGPEYAYVDKNGDCLVPVGYKTKDNFNLRSWVNGQRSHKNTLSRERRQLLKALGFVWNTFETAWEEGYAHLKDYVDSQGDCRMPALYKTTDGFRLGGWVRVQRRVKDTLAKERKNRLEALKGWEWDIPSAQWEEGFQQGV